MKARAWAWVGFWVVCGCSGRPTGGGGAGGGCEAALQPGDLVFTEVMADPAGTDEGREWFEVFNATGQDLLLKGVVVASAKTDGSSEMRLTMGEVTAPAGGYLVFGNAMPAAAPAWMNFPYANALGDLRQTSGGRLRILCGDTVVDEVVFPKAPASASWSLDGSQAPDAARNDDPAHWCAATIEYEPGNRGSPGQPNEACAQAIPEGSCWDGQQVRPLRVPTVGDLVISEFHAKPAAVSYQRGEWVEFAVLHDVDLNGVGLGANDGEPRVLFDAAQCVEASAGTYYVFVRNVDPSLNGGITEAAGKLPFGLTDSGMRLVLTVQGHVLDEVAYDAKWVKKGVSVALDPRHLDPVKNDTFAHWCFATNPYGSGDLGTPGSANEACP